MPSITIPACGDCCDPCTYTGDLEVLFSGLTLCTDCKANVPALGFRSYQLSSFTLSGPYTVTFISPGLWQIVGVGAWAGDDYAPSTVCGGAPTPISGAWVLTIACAAGVFSIDATLDSIGTGFSGSGDLDAAITNTVTGCGISSDLIPTHGGTATVTRA